MQCRAQCGACCIAASLTQPYFGMPKGKAAGELCVHLDRQDYTCAIWGTEHYPKACRNFAPSEEFCGNSREEALAILGELEILTLPSQK